MVRGRISAVAVAAWFVLSAPAAAVQPDNVRLYSILTTNATLSIQGGNAETIGANSVNFYHFMPGQYQFVLTDANGDSVTLNADFEDANMATMRGRSWWCITTGRRTADNVLVLMLDSPSQCTDMLKVAPTEHDDPNDDP